jgi:hypothetical protein
VGFLVILDLIEGDSRRLGPTLAFTDFFLFALGETDFILILGDGMEEKCQRGFEIVFVYERTAEVNRKRRLTAHQRPACWHAGWLDLRQLCTNFNLSKRSAEHSEAQ